MQCEIISILIKYLTRISLSQHEHSDRHSAKERDGPNVMACKRLPLAASNSSEKGHSANGVRWGDFPLPAPHFPYTHIPAYLSRLCLFLAIF